MVEQRNRLAVEIDEGIARIAPANDEEPAADRARPRHAGKVFDDLQGVALRSGDALDFGGRDGGLGKLLPLALAADGGLVRVLVERLQEGDDVLAAPLGDLLLDLETVVARRRDDDLSRSGGDAAQFESPLPVGDGAKVGIRDRHLDPGKLAPRPALADDTGEIDRRLHGGARSRLRRRVDEVERVLDADRYRLF